MVGRALHTTHPRGPKKPRETSETTQAEQLVRFNKDTTRCFLSVISYRVLYRPVLSEEQ